MDVPIDIGREIFQHLNFGKVVSMVTNTPMARLLYDKAFLLNVSGMYVKSEWELQWIRTLDTDATKQLIIKWQAESVTEHSPGIGYSPGAENFIDIEKLIYLANIHKDGTFLGYLSDICYTPVPVCKALSQLGDHTCIDIIKGNSYLRSECIEKATNGAIMGGKNQLFRELVQLERIQQSYLETTIMYNNLDAFLFLRDKSGSRRDDLDPNEILYAVGVNGWGEYMDNIIGYVASNNFEELSRRRGIGNNTCYISSIEMVDYLMRDPNNHWTVWKSLVSFLDGRPETPVLLRHFDHKYGQPTTSKTTLIYLVKYMYNIEVEVPKPVRDGVVKYISSTKFSPSDKLMILQSMHVLHIDNIESATKGLATDDIDYLIDIIVETMEDRDSRHLIDVILYLVGLSSHPEETVMNTMFKHQSVETMIALASLIGRDDKWACNTALQRASQQGETVYNVIPYYHHVMGMKEVPLVDGEMMISNVDMCVICRDVMDLSNALNANKEMEDDQNVQIILSLMVGKGELSTTTTLANYYESS